MAAVDTVFLTIGVDLGQRHDPTAIAVCEIIDEAPQQASPRFRYEVRHLERLPLGMTYPGIADRLGAVQQRAVHAVRQREMQRDPSMRPSVVLETFVDATGALPAVDLFSEHGLQVMPCFFTHGDRRTETGDQITVGKAWLVNRLQALGQAGWLLLPPSHPEAQAMMRELLDYEIRVDTDANDRYGAFRVGAHDDLVTALGLAVQWEPRDWYGWDELEDYMARQLGRRA